MSIQISEIASAVTYKSSATLSDYGNVVDDNGNNLSITTNTYIASTLEFFKSIQQCLTSLGISSTITTYVNSTTQDSKYICPSISFIIDGVETQLTDYYLTNSTVLLYACSRDNATSTMIRPPIPSATNKFYDSYNSLNAELYGFLGEMQDTSFWQSVTSSSAYICNVQVAVFDKVFYLMAKCNNQYYFAVSGKLGTGVGCKPLGVCGSNKMGHSGITMAALSTNETSGSFGEVLSPIISNQTLNTTINTVAFPVYFTTSQASNATPIQPGVLLVDTKYLLAISNIPNRQPGVTFANKTWLCPYTRYDLYSTSAPMLIMPWDGHSTSIFD